MMENIETARQLYQSKRKVIKNKRIVKRIRILFPYSRKFRFPFELKRSRIKETLKSHLYKGGWQVFHRNRSQKKKGGGKKKETQWKMGQCNLTEALPRLLL